MCKVPIIDCIHHCVLKSSKSKVFLNKLVNVKTILCILFLSKYKICKDSFYRIKVSSKDSEMSSGYFLPGGLTLKQALEGEWGRTLLSAELLGRLLEETHNLSRSKWRL